jgi:hypothetical protein
MLSTLSSCRNQEETVAAPQFNASGVIFILGKADGMPDETFELLKQACSSAIKSVDPGHYAGAVGFGWGAEIVIPLGLTHSASDVNAKLSAFKVNSGAHLTSALLKAQQMFALQEAAAPLKRKLVILLSGGAPMVSDYKEALKQLVDAGATVSTISVNTKGLNLPLFAEIATLGKGYSYFTDFAKYGVKDCSRLMIEETRRVLGP